MATTSVIRLFAGVPSIDPALAAVDTIVVQSAALDPSAPGPGPIVDLVLRRPASLWSGDVRVNLAPPALQSDGDAIPPITRLKSGGDGDIAAGGPLGETCGPLPGGTGCLGRAD